MALLALVRGANVGGHRIFRPSVIAAELAHLDVVNIGAAGTFVIRQPVTQTRLRAELARKLPFDAEIVICNGRDVLKMMSQDYFADQPVRSDVVRFVSVLSRKPDMAPSIPVSFPASGEWLLKILACDGRFVIGIYRRQMKTIGYLGRIDRLFGAPATTRNWNTFNAIAEALAGF